MLNLRVLMFTFDRFILKVNLGPESLTEDNLWNLYSSACQVWYYCHIIIAVSENLGTKPV